MAVPPVIVSPTEGGTMAVTSFEAPETDIRKLYQFLRDYPRSSMHLEIAETISKKPAKLAEMLERSREQCAGYRNDGESFHQGRGKGGIQFTEARLASDRLANRVLVSLSSHGDAVSFPFTFVDYEIRPFRVSRRMAKQVSTSKEGQIDILMRSPRGAPVIGEIKAKNDATLLLALVQSLASAVEFASPAQRKRLAKAYGDVGIQEGGTGVEVCLIQSSPPKDERSMRIAKAVGRISARLMSEPASQKVIGRIACVDVTPDRSEPFQWKTMFDYQAK